MKVSGHIRERLFSALNLYVAVQLVGQFAVTLGGIGLLIFLFDTLELLRRATDNAQLGIGGICGLALLKFPHGLQVTFPFAIMIATMLMYFRLSRSNQLIAMLSAGHSVWQLVAAPAMLALAFGLLNLVVFDPLASHLYQDYQSLEDTLVRRLDHPFNLTSAGIWARELRDGETTILYSPTIKEDGASLILGHVTIFKNVDDRPIQRFEAESGRLIGGQIVLADVWQFSLSSSAPVATHSGGISLPTTLTSERLQSSFAPPETMTVMELSDFIATSASAGFSSARHRLYFHAQLASPLLCAAMAMIAAAFYLLPTPRLAGWIVRGTLAVFAGFVLYFWNRFTFALGLTGALPIPLAAWSGTAPALLLSVSYLLHRQDA